ncbi:TetR/AcrR family transcriptional regulator [Georgenia sp. Z1491]|uniref:TetR/AcrR family transcriptional regulator n=1 Tax=Georgenia sp. Z1491 TaxID=3416707 RepID=UPI003CEA6E5D
MAQSEAGGPRGTIDAGRVREAALTTFARVGFHGSSMGQVAALLGVRAPSLYNHMASKDLLLEEIVLATAEQVWRDFEDAVRTERTPERRLWAAVRVYALRHATHPREAVIVNRDARSLAPPARDRALALLRRHERGVRGLIEAGVANGRFGTEHPALVSFGVLEMCVSVAKWFDGGGDRSAAEVAEIYADYALRMAGARD